MKLGVTGSRHKPRFGLAQKLYSFLARNDVTEVHHGDCVGWDECAFEILSRHGVKTISHPPADERLRAFTKSSVILDPKPYLDRNKDIVNSCDFLIAAPDGPERQRSGTWSTVRYAKKVGVKGVVWL